MPPSDNPFEAFRKKKLLQEKAKKLEEERKRAGRGSREPGAAVDRGDAEDPMEAFLAKGGDPHVVSHRYARPAAQESMPRPEGFEATRVQESRRTAGDSDVEGERPSIEGFDRGRFARQRGNLEGIRSPEGFDPGRWSRKSAETDLAEGAAGQDEVRRGVDP